MVQDSLAGTQPTPADCAPQVTKLLHGEVNQCVRVTLAIDECVKIVNEQQKRASR